LGSPFVPFLVFEFWSPDRDHPTSTLLPISQYVVVQLNSLPTPLSPPRPIPPPKLVYPLSASLSTFLSSLPLSFPLVPRPPLKPSLVRVSFLDQAIDRYPLSISSPFQAASLSLSFFLAARLFIPRLPSNSVKGTTPLHSPPPSFPSSLTFSPPPCEFFLKKPLLFPSPSCVSYILKTIHPKFFPPFVLRASYRSGLIFLFFIVVPFAYVVIYPFLLDETPTRVVAFELYWRSICRGQRGGI